VRWGEREGEEGPDPVPLSRRGGGKGVNGGDRAETFSVGQWRLEGDLAGGGG